MTPSFEALTYENGFEVEGIEYSKDGVEMANHDNPYIRYYHGSAFNMPFNEKKYSAIYCYNVIHLFMEDERERLISLCKKVLKKDGIMFFTAFSDADEDYGRGEELEPNTFENKKNKPVHYYSGQKLIEAFKEYRVIDNGSYTEVVGHKECKLRYIIVQFSS
jgi:SAM-dependent methyltransferase